MFIVISDYSGKVEHVGIYTLARKDTPNDIGGTSCLEVGLPHTRLWLANTDQEMALCTGSKGKESRHIMAAVTPSVLFNTAMEDSRGSSKMVDLVL